MYIAYPLSFLLLLTIPSISLGDTNDSAQKIGILYRLTNMIKIIYVDYSFTGVDVHKKDIDTNNWNIKQELASDIENSLHQSGKYSILKRFDSDHAINYGTLLKNILLYDDVEDAEKYLNKLYKSKYLSGLDELLIISSAETGVPGSTNIGSNGGILGMLLQQAGSEKFSQNALYSYHTGGLTGALSLKYILIDLKSKKVISYRNITSRKHIDFQSKLSNDEKNQIYNFSIASGTTTEDKKKLKNLIFNSSLSDTDKEEIIKTHIKGVNTYDEEDEDNSQFIKTLLHDNKLIPSQIPTNFSNKNSSFDKDFEDIQKTAAADITYAITTGLQLEQERQKKLLAKQAAEDKLNADFGDSEEY